MASIRWGLIHFRGLLLLVVAAFACSAHPAFAQSSDKQGFPDQGAAWSACMAAANAQWPGSPARCRAGTDSCIPYGLGTGTCSNYQKCLYDSNNGYSCDNYWYAYPQASTCSTREDEYTWAPPGGVAGGNVCSQGCTYTYVLDASSGNFFSPTGTTCTTTDAPEPVIDTDGDGVPDEDDAFPNDPNESQDTDGDGIGDNADFSPNDPTDGSDTPGEEDGDDEGDNTASGGGDCKAPPSCKGDGIQCNQLFQQWQIRCSGATVTGDPTNCSSGYSCSGDSVQCATVALLRKTACATADDGGTGGTPGDANGNGVADVLEGSGAGDTGDPGQDDDVTRFGIGVDASLLDQENIFGGGSCPAPPSLTIMGKTISGSDFPYWCQAMAILRALILIFGAFTAVKILTGWGFS